MMRQFSLVPQQPDPETIVPDPAKNGKIFNAKQIWAMYEFIEGNSIFGLNLLLQGHMPAQGPV